VTEVALRLTASVGGGVTVAETDALVDALAVRPNESLTVTRPGMCRQRQVCVTLNPVPVTSGEPSPKLNVADVGAAMTCALSVAALPTVTEFALRLTARLRRVGGVGVTGSCEATTVTDDVSEPAVAVMVRRASRPAFTAPF
jgi:hypothetical protein